MDSIEVEYKINLPEGCEIENISIADQKRSEKYPDIFHFDGNIFIEIELFDGNQKLTHHEKKELQVNLSRSRYKSKDVDLKIHDYTYTKENNVCRLIVTYEVCGNDINYEEFCSLGDEDISSKLRDYLHRNSSLAPSLDEDKIIILDPVVEEEDIDVSVPQEDISLNLIRSEEDIHPLEEKENIKEKPIENKVKNEIFSERYQSGFRFYRLKKNDTLESIADKFNITRQSLLSLNPNKEWKENCLIQLPNNV